MLYTNSPIYQSNQSTNRPIDQSTNRPIDQLGNLFNRRSKSGSPSQLLLDAED